jgi:beta-glucosidase
MDIGFCDPKSKPAGMKQSQHRAGGSGGNGTFPRLLLIIFLANAPCQAATPQALLGSLTLPEKLSLLHGPFAATPDHVPPGARGSAGYVPGVPRLGIPALQETDAGLGVTNPNAIRPGDTAMALPSGMAMAASFDPDAAYRNGAMLGREAASRGFNMVLGGGADLVRDPRGGRAFEYAGEDPLLAGVMVGASVRGVQDQHVMATVKHFAVNDQETGRLVLSAQLSDVALRATDLLAFEIAIEQGHPASVMCAYNRVNGVYACENPDLLNVALKQDWHFPGWVMSDWGAVHSVGAINAGLDQESGEGFDPQVFFGATLAQAVASGTVPVARVDDAVGRILHGMAAAGLMAHRAPPPRDEAGDLAVARRNAAEGIVLPLRRDLKSVCMFGGNADAGAPAGGGSSQVTPVGGAARAIVVRPDIQPVAFGTQVYDPPSPVSRIAAKLTHGAVMFDDGHDAAAAAARAKSCDVAIVFAQNFSGEMADLPDLSLPGGQDGLVRAVTAANPRSVVVLETAGAVLMPWLSQANAVLEAWYPGSGGADAIADVLFGDAAPGGRLPVTFPASVQDLPNPVLPGTGVPAGTAFSVRYPEGADVGYRGFAKRHVKPLFPFGFGLSTSDVFYPEFHARGGQTVKATIVIRNTGTRDAVDVPQLYLIERDGQPILRLLGWARRMMKPGEVQSVTVTADPRLLADFDPVARRWVIGGGTVRVGLGVNAQDMRMTATVKLDARTLPP